MQVFAIVLNYKSFEDTEKVVDDLMQQQKVDLKIIVVDNKSPNESYEVLSSKYRNEGKVTVLQTGFNGGYSYGNNFGLRYIGKFNPNYAVVLNNDVRLYDKLLLHNLLFEIKKLKNTIVVSPIMLRNGMEHLTAWKIPSIYTSIRTTPRLGRKRIKAKRLFYNFGPDDKNEKVECLNGSFQFFDYNKFQKIGFYDERVFLFNEEIILAHKIKKAGGISILCKKYTYEHHCSKTIDVEMNKIEKLKMSQKSRLYFHKNYTTKSILLLTLLKIVHKWSLTEEFLIYRLRKILGRV